MRIFLAIVIIASLSKCSYKGNELSESPENKENSIIESTGEKSVSVIEVKKYRLAYDKVLSLWPVPFREVSVPTHYGNAHIVVSGPENASPVVLLHGMNASSTMWYPNIEQLVKNHRVFAIDNLTEPGKSEMNREISNIEDLMKWYLEVLDHLKIDKFSLIGASKGGWLATNLAIHIPDRVEKLILLSPLQTFSKIPPGIKLFRSVLYAVNPNRRRLKNVLNSMSTHTSGIDPLFIEQFHLGAKMADPARFMSSIVPFSPGQLKTLNMPVLVMIGEQDIINNTTVINRASKHLPQAETTIVPDAGHFLSMDRADVTNRLISDFLNESYVDTR